MTVAVDRVPAFIRACREASADRSVRKAVKAWTPKEALDPRTLRRLYRLPGALDLLQAIVRRVVFPERTAYYCQVDDCNCRLDSSHVFLADDLAHNQLAGSSPKDMFPRTTWSTAVAVIT